MGEEIILYGTTIIRSLLVKGIFLESLTSSLDQMKYTIIPIIANVPSVYNIILIIVPNANPKNIFSINT